MNATILIPSRYESSRFPGKPVALIAGKPMIQWVYERARQAAVTDRVVVTTDDARIAACVRGFGGDVVMTAQACRSGSDRVAEAAEKLHLGPQQLVINLQGDQPLVDPRCLDEVLAPFQQNPHLPMSTLAVAITRESEITDPKDVKVVCDVRGMALYFSRAAIPYGRDNWRHTVYKHLGVYAYPRWFLDIFRSLPDGRLEQIEKLEQLRAMEHGHPIAVQITRYDSPEVDLPEDIPRIEALIRSGAATS